MPNELKIIYKYKIPYLLNETEKFDHSIIIHLITDIQTKTGINETQIYFYGYSRVKILQLLKRIFHTRIPGTIFCNLDFPSCYIFI